MDHADTAAAKAQTAPAADAQGKPDSPTDLTASSWRFTAKQAWQEFGHDQCTDLAAALTYYSVLALFPALVALVSLLGVFGQDESTVSTMLELVRSLGQAGAADVLEQPIRQMVNAQAAGAGLIVGLLGALWSASGYVGAFSRAMNRIFEIDEGRPVWKLRPLQLLITLACVLAVAAVLIALVVSGPVAESLGATLGIGQTVVTIWNIAKWPVILLVVVVIVAVLYYATPNVQQPTFRWISVGAAIAITVWVLASIGFGFYVANFGSYNKTYGSLAGVIVFLLWLWLTNLALLFGAQVDAEMERARQLQAGIAAEESIQLPPRDDRKSKKTQAKREAAIAEGRELRRQAYRAHGDERDQEQDAQGAGESHDVPALERGHQAPNHVDRINRAGGSAAAGRPAAGVVTGVVLGAAELVLNKVRRRH